MPDDPKQERYQREDGLLRFNLAMQRSRGFVYLFALVIGGLALRVGILQGQLWHGIAIATAGLASAIAFHVFYKAGIDRRLDWNVFWVWLLFDSAAVTLGVILSGGVRSPWYLFYVAVSACAAFTAGARGAWIISSVNASAYLGFLLATGGVQPFDSDFFLALYQIGFLYFCSAFFFSGIANLREKRLLIRELREEDRRRVAELTRLTEELDLKSRELVAANQKIREADRLKSQFLANMSHELRTPMNAIIGFSEILSERLEGKIEPKQHGFIHHILSSGQHLLNIINDILDLSKIEAGRMEIYPETFQIPQVAHEIVSVMKANAARSGVEIEIELPDDMPAVTTDLAKFRQILFNLISNAIKFSPRGETVTLHGQAVQEDQETELEISLTDRGPGIKKEHQALIFQEFRQIEATPRADTSGTGLGLALVKRFCELLGGRVSVESAPGRGSTFTVRLPLRYSGSAAMLPPDVEQASPAHSKMPRILVVEDDDVAFDSLSRHLASASYLPVRARHGDEALRLARTLHPSAITLDLVLPGLDGWDVLKKLKGDPETAEIPVVIVSMVDHRELGLALGAHDYFVKPVDRKRLVERVRQVTGESIDRGPRRLLVIDDDDAYRDLLAEELKPFGFTISLASSGEEGLTLARAELPDVVVLDLVMPGMSGFEVAEELKRWEETAGIPILVMTSKDLTTEDRSQLQSKIAALIPKGRLPASRLITAIQQLKR